MTKISVLVLTYNHSAYIKQCIDSILLQSVNADLEIIIGDDCSTDGTQLLLKNLYADKNNVSLILREENLGASLNFIDIISNATGDYLVYIDGDDYMLPGKLDAQLKVFECNPEVNLVHHNVDIVDSNDSCVRVGNIKKGVFGDINDLLNQCQTNIQSCAVMLRNRNVIWKDLIPEDSKIQDMPFIYNLLGSGRIIYINKSLSAYRVHSNSVSRTTNLLILEEWARFFIEQTQLCPTVKMSSIRTSLKVSYLRDVCLYIKEGDYSGAKKTLEIANKFPLGFNRHIYFQYALILKVLFTIGYKRIIK
ncbi:glycosyltransferase [Shewanella oncorhynchi]|uniref:glycosyltransferase n=1 Tax=Shewanella oncorhynchi TaxID=2726434 RepID=UPI003D7962AD